MRIVQKYSYQKVFITHSILQLEELIVQFEKAKTLMDNTGKRLASSEASLYEKNQRIDVLKKENRKLMEEALEMKYEFVGWLFYSVLTGTKTR